MNFKNYLRYEPNTGLIYWHTVRTPRIKVGDLAGCIDHRIGYKKLNFSGKSYMYHRVAWYLYYNRWPKGIIDHINRDKLDNRIENLRDVTNRENLQNAIHYNKGAFLEKSSGKWVAQIHINGRNKKLGRFESMEQAQEAYLNYLEEID